MNNIDKNTCNDTEDIWLQAYMYKGKKDKINDPKKLIVLENKILFNL